MVSVVVKRILSWYGVHQRRHLPWRNIRDPYKILVSEIMLQQTQVDRVIPKYKEFLRQFPTVNTLAQAKTSDVITAWKGLGYNRRALYLQRTAQAVIHTYGGKFPSDLDELKKLPGIGDYTARAILSFAFKQSTPVLDTNHRRFYERVFFGLRKKKDKDLLKKAGEVVQSFNSPNDVYDWNQALMDFGSLVCLSGRPKCEECPVQKYCRAYPVILKRKVKNEKRKIIVPFRETDRYFRGRIIDLLREQNQLSLTFLQKHFAELSLERFSKIVIQLKKDGLIVEKKGSILLP